MQVATTVVGNTDTLNRGGKNMTVSITKQKPSLKSRTIATIIAVFSAVALPQIIHLLGSATGLGTSLGEMLLPMHLPVILAGLLMGPSVAGAAGLLSPLISFALTGMPAAVMLPFMMIELTAYGICAGMLKDTKIPDISKVLIVQLTGRVIRAAAILIGFHVIGTAVKPEIILTSVKTGLVGIALQLMIIPFVLYRQKNADNE